MFYFMGYKESNPLKFSLKCNKQVSVKSLLTFRISYSDCLKGPGDSDRVVIDLLLNRE